MGAPLKRTAAAGALTAAAVLLPLAAWYASGSREAAREARASGQRLAERLAARLEALKEAESRRPYYHYQRFYHDPKGASEGASVIPSPLTEAPGDPLIRCHFQADAAGVVSTPADPSLLAGLGPLPREARSQAQDREQQGQVLSNEAWAQNSAAGRIYEELRRSSGKSALNLDAPQGEVRIRLSAFEWRDLNGSLAALRTVATPAGELLQGFQVSEPAVEAWLREADPSVRLGRRGPGIPVPLPGPPWTLSLGSAGGQVRFLGTFLTGASLAVFSGLCLVGLVWQSERLARQRAQFAASAAHELRTPLAGLRMYGEMLAEGLGDPAKAKEYARRVADEAERLGRVVSNVLGFTRLERGTLRAKPEPGDLAEALREAAERLRPSLEAQGVRLELDLDRPLPAAFDRDAVVQILQNLLDNAEKYTRGSADRTVRVALAERGFSVSDRGPGIPPALQARLFRAFARGEDPDHPAGMGLGLALSRALAKAQGGDLSCAVREGGGTVFTLRLPG